MFLSPLPSFPLSRASAAEVWRSAHCGGRSPRRGLRRQRYDHRLDRQYHCRLAFRAHTPSITARLWLRRGLPVMLLTCLVSSILLPCSTTGCDRRSPGHPVEPDVGFFGMMNLTVGRCILNIAFSADPGDRPLDAAAGDLERDMSMTPVHLMILRRLCRIRILIQPRAPSNPWARLSFTSPAAVVSWAPECYASYRTPRRRRREGP